MRGVQINEREQIQAKIKQIAIWHCACVLYVKNELVDVRGWTLDNSDTVAGFLASCFHTLHIPRIEPAIWERFSNARVWHPPIIHNSRTSHNTESKFRWRHEKTNGLCDVRCANPQNIHVFLIYLIESVTSTGTIPSHTDNVYNNLTENVAPNPRRHPHGSMVHNTYHLLLGTLKRHHTSLIVLHPTWN